MAISAIRVSALSCRVKPSGGANRRLEGASGLMFDRLTMTGRPGAALAIRSGAAFKSDARQTWNGAFEPSLDSTSNSVLWQ